MRAELKRLQRELGRTLVYVTHDQVEAMSMPDRVAVLCNGALQQIDPPETIYHRPANRFVATVIGSPPMNFIPITVDAQNGSLRLVHERFAIDSTEAPAGRVRAGASGFIGIRPEDIRISQAGEGISAQVYATEPLGGETVVDVTIGDRVIKALAPPTLELSVDDRVGVVLDPGRLHLFDDAGDAALSAAGTDGMFRVAAKA
jgi:multiple sugar transport system ATP-binding protein